MGQSLSTEAPEGTEGPKFSLKQCTRDALAVQFTTDVLKSYRPIELQTLHRNLGLDELTVDAQISQNDLFEMLGLPQDMPVAPILFRSLKFLGLFPNLSCIGTDQNEKHADEDSITVGELLKAVALLDEDIGDKLFGKEAVDQTHLLTLVVLSLCEFGPNAVAAPEMSEVIDVLTIGSRIQWLKVPMVQSFDAIDLDECQVSAADLLELITFMLIISPISLAQNKTLTLSRMFKFDKETWMAYRETAFNILRSFDFTLSTANYSEKSLSVAQILRLVGHSLKDTYSTFPHLFAPLHFYCDSLFYDQKLAAKPFVPDKQGSRILDGPHLAQLATVLSQELALTRLQRLYMASKDGFSLNALQTKIFKWNAPTIMLIRGRYIAKEGTSAKNSKLRAYKEIRDIFPKFYPVSSSPTLQPDNDDLVDNHVVLFMVYIKQPWRVSNKVCFGDESSFIAELGSRQILFKRSGISENYAYYSNVGGGIGFGSQPPLTKGPVKIYKPGEVSLTIDSSLEVANFRHLGVPGTFANGSCFTDRKHIPEYELFFRITEMEVWGCGSEEELEKQKGRWEWENREAVKRQQLNAAQWDDGRALLEMAGIVGHNQSGGSV